MKIQVTTPAIIITSLFLFSGCGYNAYSTHSHHGVSQSTYCEKLAHALNPSDHHYTMGKPSYEMMKSQRYKDYYRYCSDKP